MPFASNCDLKRPIFLEFHGIQLLLQGFRSNEVFQSHRLGLHLEELIGG